MLSTSLPVNILPYPFADMVLPNITIKAGEQLELSLDNLTRPSGHMFQYSLACSSSWLTCGSNLTIQGAPPTDSSPTAPVEICLISSTLMNYTVSAAFFVELIPSLGSTALASSSRLHVHQLLMIIALSVAMVGLVGLLVGLNKRRSLRRGTTTRSLGTGPVLPSALIFAHPYDNGSLAPSMDKSSYRSGTKSQDNAHFTSMPPYDPADSAQLERKSPFLQSTPSSLSPPKYGLRQNSYERVVPNRHRSVLDISPSMTLPTVAEEKESRNSIQSLEAIDNNRNEQSDIAEASRKIQLSTAPSAAASMTHMPSMNFGLLLSPAPLDHSASPTTESSLDDHPNTSRTRRYFDIHAISSQSQDTETRSVNSEYDSLPSWDSESTWHYERRRRPPSPVWRRDDVEKDITLWDKMHEEAKNL
ncbi:hypothetical protein DL93DRAFT_2082871, partial [Clavulina sp. PMI_390]